MNRRLCAFFGAFSLIACGTETGSSSVSLDGFDTAGCKSKQGQALTAKSGASSASVSDPEHDGFTCVLWERLDDETLRVEFTNHTDGCGADMGWQPRIERNDRGGLDIYLDNKECVFAACGYCVYDLAFTARIPADVGDIEVRLLGDACNGPAEQRRSAALPLSTQRKGSLCTSYRPRDFGEAYSCTTGAGPWRYCTSPIAADQASCTADPETFCADGLACTDIGEAGSLCLPKCESDAPCADAGPTHCEEGVCKL